MTRIKKSIKIEAPVEEVWRLVAYPENLPKFIEAIEGYEVLTDKRVGVGATYLWTSKFLGREIRVKEEITEWKENERVSYKGVGKWGYDFTVEVRGLNSKSKFSIDIDYETPYSIFGKFLDKIFMKRKVEEAFEKAMKKAKAILEGKLRVDEK